MQRIFETNCSIQEYVEKGKNYPFPELSLCPCCKREKPHKHGFYKRFCLDGHIIYRIFIRRYYCQKCRTTISFLPDFCIPKFQYSLSVLERVLQLRFERKHSLKRCIEVLHYEFPQLDWLPQKISFYAKRFLDNLPRLELVLRSLFPQMRLGSDKEKRAKKVLVTVLSNANGIQKPARLFYEQCHRSFLASLC